MLEGLEISELKISDVSFAHVDFRIDSEFYGKENLRKENCLKRMPHGALGTISNLIAGPFGSAVTTDKYDQKSGFRYIRATDIKSFFLNDYSPVFVNRETFDNFPQFHLKEEDILLTVVGMNFGIPAIISEEDCPAIFSCKSTLIRNPSVNPYYLLAYLSSHTGYGLVRRGYRGAAQPGINLSDVGNVLVPLLSNDFQLKIELLLKEARAFIVKSKAAYLQAEANLFESLGMKNFHSSECGINIKSIKESFHTTGRLDAEYYQPKYEQVVSHICDNQHERLGNLVSIRKSIEPGSSAYADDSDGLPFLRVADYNKFGLSKPQALLNAAYCLQNKDELNSLKPKKNTILYSKDGSVGEAFCLTDDAEFVTSGAILHLSILEHKKILPDYLTLVLNSQLVKMQAERDAGGSIILHWRINEIENALIPLASFPMQQKIAREVNACFEYKRESERILNSTKYAFEIAIEDSEAAALTYLNGII